MSERAAPPSQQGADFLDRHDPATTEPLEFLRARFDDAERLVAEGPAWSLRVAIRRRSIRRSLVSAGPLWPSPAAATQSPTLARLNGSVCPTTPPGRRWSSIVASASLTVGSERVTEIDVCFESYTWAPVGPTVVAGPEFLSAAVVPVTETKGTALAIEATPAASSPVAEHRTLRARNAAALDAYGLPFSSGTVRRVRHRSRASRPDAPEPHAKADFRSQRPSPRQIGYRDMAGRGRRPSLPSSCAFASWDSVSGAAVVGVELAHAPHPVIPVVS